MYQSSVLVVRENIFSADSETTAIFKVICQWSFFLTVKGNFPPGFNICHDVCQGESRREETTRLHATQTYWLLWRHASLCLT